MGGVGSGASGAGEAMLIGEVATGVGREGGGAFYIPMLCGLMSRKGQKAGYRGFMICYRWLGYYIELR